MYTFNTSVNVNLTAAGLGILFCLVRAMFAYAEARLRSTPETLKPRYRSRGRGYVFALVVLMAFTALLYLTPQIKPVPTRLAYALVALSLVYLVTCIVSVILNIRTLDVPGYKDHAPGAGTVGAILAFAFFVEACASFPDDNPCRTTLLKWNFISLIGTFAVLAGFTACWILRARRLYPSSPDDDDPPRQ